MGREIRFSMNYIKLIVGFLKKTFLGTDRAFLRVEFEDLRKKIRVLCKNPQEKRMLKLLHFDAWLEHAIAQAK